MSHDAICQFDTIVFDFSFAYIFNKCASFYAVIRGRLKPILVPCFSIYNKETFKTDNFRTGKNKNICKFSQTILGTSTLDPSCANRKPLNQSMVQDNGDRKIDQLFETKNYPSLTFLWLFPAATTLEYSEYFFTLSFLVSPFYMRMFQ